jgi:hypothetical protein
MTIAPHPHPRVGVIWKDLTVFYKVLFIVKQPSGKLMYHCVGPSDNKLYRIAEDDEDFFGLVALDD